jgi:hypothetical protein
VAVVTPHPHLTAPNDIVVMLVLLMQAICKVWMWEGSLWRDILAEFNGNLAVLSLGKRDAHIFFYMLYHMK